MKKDVSYWLLVIVFGKSSYELWELTLRSFGVWALLFAHNLKAPQVRAHTSYPIATTP
jgi:hypothetical protein